MQIKTISKESSACRAFWVIMATMTLVLSCTRPSGESDGVLEKVETFPAVRSAVCDAVEVGLPMNIDAWHATDTVLICHSNGTEACFYVFSLPDLVVTDSIGRVGNGPGEVVMPVLMPVAGSKECMVLDNGSGKIYTVSPASQLVEYASVTGMLNRPYLLSDSVVAYTDFTRDTFSWCARSIPSGDMISSIDLAPASNGSHQNFGWRIGDNGKLVLFLYGVNKVGMADVGPDGKIEGLQWYEGTDKVVDGADYYSSMCCGPRYIYLLSSKTIDPATFDGDAEVEIYDYEMRPVAKLQLDIPAWMIALDERHRQLIFTTPFDDDLHTVSLLDSEI